ncbi:MAG: class I adenylate-forming enzyme family protein [Albidovulum sp.]
MLSVTDPSFAPPCPARFNLAAYVLARAYDLPNKTALEILTVAGADVWTYDQLDQAVRGVAWGLLGLGLKPGARIMLRLDNSVEFPLAFLGAIAAGLLPVATPAMLTVDELTHLAAEVRPALVIADAGLPQPDAPGIQTISTADLAAFAAGPKAEFILGRAERPAYLVYTSGTSGAPRAVVHAHKAIWARRMMWDGWYDLRQDDRLLHAGALNWTFTLGTGLFDPWAAGATALIAKTGTTPDALPKIIARSEATLFAAAPAIYRKLLKNRPTLDAPKLRHGLSAGEQLSDRIRHDWIAATGKPIYEAYGLSECSTFISSCPARPAPDGAIGYPQSGRSMAILGPDGAPVARDTPGVIAVHRKDPGLFLEYFGAATDTAAKFRGDWFLTGDIGIMASDGAIQYIGRDDDMMNAGGLRVSPQEVEAVLADCPDIGGVAITEVSPQEDVKIIAAFYTGPASADAVRAFAQARLAPYKCPRHWENISHLPTSANGKLNRRALRKEWETRL